MRSIFTGMIAVVACAGCAARSQQVVTNTTPKSVPQAELAKAPDPIETHPTSATHAPREPIAAPPAITEEEIRSLVDSAVAQEFATREQQRAAAQAAQSQKLATETRAAAEAAAQAAEKAAQQEVQQRADEATSAARHDDELLARFLLLPDELERVERIKEKLKTESIWDLTRQDLDFAAVGFAAPLLHDALYEAAGRNDPDIDLDALANKAELTPEEKIQLATMPPVERERLLMFTGQFENGKPSIEADRYVREFINQYPFMRKILLVHLRNKE